jgi:hypothetical protein
MKIMLGDDYRIDYDGLGYTLMALKAKQDKAGAVDLVWEPEGFYGTIAQSVDGAYRHGIHGMNLDTLEQLKCLQEAFTHRVVDAVKLVMERSENEQNYDEH